MSLPANAPPTEVEVAVFDLAGRKVASTAVTCPGEGKYEMAWDCRASNGAPLAPGVYVYRVKAAESAVAGKVVVAR